MSSKIVMVKERGTHPAAEGVLASIATVHPITSIEDADDVAGANLDIVMIDVAMPRLNAQDVLRALRRASKNKPPFILFDFNQRPGLLLRRLTQLAQARAALQPRTMTVAQIARLLALSQEVLARILNVSVRTAHRWMKGARPRPRPELQQLQRTVTLLGRTFPDERDIRAYLYHPNPSLEGERPIDLLCRREFEHMAGDLEAVREGVYL